MAAVGNATAWRIRDDDQERQIVLIAAALSRVTAPG
jgi:hypothetical protein